MSGKLKALAPHVQAAISTAMQRKAPAAVGGTAPATHVEGAISGAMQRKTSRGPALAAHVESAISQTMQPKAPVATSGPAPTNHVEAAIVEGRGARGAQAQTTRKAMPESLTARHVGPAVQGPLASTPKAVRQRAGSSKDSVINQFPAKQRAIDHGLSVSPRSKRVDPMAVQPMRATWELAKSKVMSSVPSGVQILEQLPHGFAVGRVSHNPNHNGPLLTLYQNQVSKGYISFQKTDESVILHTGGGVGADATGLLFKHALQILRTEFEGYPLELAPAPGAATKKTVELLANALSRVVDHEGVRGVQVGLAKSQMETARNLAMGRERDGYKPSGGLNDWDSRLMLETTTHLEAIGRFARSLDFGMGFLLSHGNVLGNMYGTHTSGLDRVTARDWYLTDSGPVATVGIKFPAGDVERISNSLS